MDITNVVRASKTYDTSLGLSDKEKKDKTPAGSEDYITFGEAMPGGIEAHNFSSGISLKTTTPGKTGKAEDKEPRDDQTMKSAYSFGGDTTKAPTVAPGSEMDSDFCSFASSILTEEEEEGTHDKGKGNEPGEGGDAKDNAAGVEAKLKNMKMGGTPTNRHIDGEEEEEFQEYCNNKDNVWHQKYDPAETYKQALWNIAGPTLAGIKHQSDSIVTTIETIAELEENNEMANKTLTDFNHDDEIIHYLKLEGGTNWQERKTFVETEVADMEEQYRKSWIEYSKIQNKPSKTHAAENTGAADSAQEAGTASQEATEAQDESERSGQGAG